MAGGSGFVGRYIVETALAAGDDVTVLGRTAPEIAFFSKPLSARLRFVPFSLGDSPPLKGVEVLVHAAFDHVPGRYRGGEGGDLPGFLARNVDGSCRLIDAALEQGVERIVFLSSRAIYGNYPAGTPLTEDLPPRPDTAYGAAKREVERHLAQAGRGASLRATGIYGAAGPGRRHKWYDLFAAFRRGEPIAPRVGTEVHGADVARAVRLLATSPGPAVAGRVFNCSDLLLDRRDLLGRAAAIADWRGSLPDAADAAATCVMQTRALKALGWRPGGFDLLEATLPGLVADVERAERASADPLEAAPGE